MRATIKERHVAWPPVIINQTPMGIHRDGKLKSPLQILPSGVPLTTIVTTNRYSRDIGQSSILSNGDILFQEVSPSLVSLTAFNNSGGDLQQKLRDILLYF